MPMSRVDEVGPVVLEQLRAGASFAAAARAAGVTAAVVRGWVAKGRQVPNGHWGVFAAAAADLPAPLAERAAGGDSLPDRDELLRLLAAKSREGNVRAIELMLREIAPRKQAASTDALDELDELAQRRGTAAA